LHWGLWASGKARYEPDQIATIVQPLIIDWPIAGGIGRALDQKDRAAGRDLERLGGNRVGRGRFQLVFSFDFTTNTLCFLAARAALSKLDKPQSGKSKNLSRQSDLPPTGVDDRYSSAG
jgi:hypothetical protein